ncbi:MAG: hypothetical protein HOO98_12620, partial [Nitrospira sp.]|nr:hypothetical protein [Nitrospira sp.]
MSPSAERQMSPDTSPGAVSPGAGVRRANKIPLYIVIGLITAVVVVVAMVASDRAEKQAQMLTSTTGPPQQKVGGTQALADRIAGSYRGIIPPAPSKPTIRKDANGSETSLVGVGSLQAEGKVNAELLIARPEDLDAPPMPHQARLQLVQGQALSNKTPGEEREALRMTRIQLLQDALKAPSTVTFSVMRSEKPAPTLVRPVESASLSDPRQRVADATRNVASAAGSDVDPTKAYQAQLAHLQQAGMLGPLGGGVESSPTAKLSAPSKTTRADHPVGGDRWKHEGAQLPPRAAFVIQAGDVIPALMISEVNSMLPGQIIAQVSQNVYDTPTKTKILIPQGTKLIGSYS